MRNRSFEKEILEVLSKTNLSDFTLVGINGKVSIYSNSGDIEIYDEVLSYYKVTHHSSLHGFWLIVERPCLY